MSLNQRADGSPDNRSAPPGAGGRGFSRLVKHHTTVPVAGALAALLIAGCGSSGGTSSGGAPGGNASPKASTVVSGSCKPGATKLTFWAWVPGMARAVTAFNQTHPNICVTQEDPGAGEPEYTAINNAIKAGSGAPDVAEIEFDELPSFTVQHAVVDLSKYGANSYKNDFVPWAWSQVTQGSSVWAMPSDFGPVAFYYDAPELARYHISPPSTWTQFSSDAVALHKANPSAYLVDFSPDDLQWLMNMMGQAGAWPIQYSGGSKITINFAGPAQMKFAGYWQNLINEHAVNTVTTANSNPVPNTNLDNGTDAAAIDSAWAPSYFQPDAKKSMGNWRAAPIPQWTQGANVQIDWGGSTYPVFSQSKHPAQAAEFSEWLTGSQASWNVVKTPPSSLFPTYAPLLNSASFKNITYPVSGNSQPNQAFAPAAGNIPPHPWPPFMTQALQQALTTIGPVLQGKTTLPKALQQLQSQEVSYAKQQGFNVSTG
jgi:multiple sugar transport system substrate-binding protein